MQLPQQRITVGKRRRTTPAADDCGVVELISIWVDPIARGRGAGDQLVEAVERWARHVGADMLRLAVADGNGAAAALYRSSRLWLMAKMSAAAKILLALDMYEFGEQAQRSRLKRMRPEASDAEIEAAVRAWRLSRPDAPLGDAVGRKSQRFA